MAPAEPRARVAPGPAFERALRLACRAHQGQSRKGDGTPYIEHPMAVALILDRAGFPEPVAIAGLLHDAVEDTDLTLAEIAGAFGPEVAALVDHASEAKLDAAGLKRPWADRKADHVRAIAGAPVEAKALVLADKIHNLLSIALDLADGRPAWDSFHAPRDRVLAYHDAMIAACRAEDPRTLALAAEAAGALAAVRRAGAGAGADRET